MSTIWNTTTNFSGGIAGNTKSALPGGYRFDRNLDTFTDDDSASLNPIPTKVSGSTVTDLVKWAADGTPWDTNRYFYGGDGGTGTIYKETSGGVWSVDRSGVSIANGGNNDPDGQGLAVLQDYLYYAGSDNIGRKGPLSGTPAFSDTFLSDGVTNLDQSGTGTGNTYTTPTSISEASTAKRAFTPTRDPIKKIEVYVTGKGTGNWTLTFHDANNNTVATATIANASLSNGANNTFTFVTPARVVNGQSYHFHITSTVADGTVGTTTASSLADCYFKEYFLILVPDLDYHPMAVFNNGVNGTLVIGNEHYLAVWDPFAGTYNPNQIALEPGFKVRGFCRYQEFLVAYCWKGANIDSTESGRFYYWDGISPYYNYYDEVTSGLPNAAVNSKNRIFSVVGSSGWLVIGTNPMRAIQPAPLLTKGNKVEVLPGAITTWQNRVLFGYSNTDDSTLFECGVYEFGSSSDRAISYTSVSTETLNNSYQISTGTTKSASLKIGLVWGVGKDLYVGWKDGSTYGVDKVSKTNNPAATGSWESLIEDRGVLAKNLVHAPQKEKLAKRVVITYPTLPTGCTVTPKYRIDRATSWTSGSAAIAGTTSATLDIDLIYHEIEYGFDCTATVNYPIFTGIYFEWDPLEGQRGDG